MTEDTKLRGRCLDLRISNRFCWFHLSCWTSTFWWYPSSRSLLLLFVIQTRCRTPYIFEGLTIGPTNTNRYETNSIQTTKIDRNRRTQDRRKDRQKRQKKKQKKRQTKEEPRVTSAENTLFLFPRERERRESREKRELHEKEREEKDKEREEKSREKREGREET